MTKVVVIKAEERSAPVEAARGVEVLGSQVFHYCAKRPKCIFFHLKIEHFIISAAKNKFEKCTMSVSSTTAIKFMP